MLRRISHNTEGVSPVIGIILIVAITVVLAAVLYVMVAGLFSGGESMNPAPAGGWQSMTSPDNSTIVLTYNNFEPPVSCTQLKLIIEDENGHEFMLWLVTNNQNGTQTMSSSDPNITAYYNDYSPVEGNVNAGDSVVINGLQPYTYYHIKVFHTPSSSIIGMLGPDSVRTAS